MAMGAISRTYLRDTAVDFSYPYFMTKVGFVTKKPSPIPNIKAILWPFGNVVWIALAVSVPAFSFVYWTFSRVDKTGFRASKYNLTVVFMHISQMLVMQGFDILLIKKDQITNVFPAGTKKWPTAWKMRILLLFWAFFALVVAYCKNVMARHKSHTDTFLFQLIMEALLPVSPIQLDLDP